MKRIFSVLAALAAAAVFTAYIAVDLDPSLAGPILRVTAAVDNFYGLGTGTFARLIGVALCFIAMVTIVVSLPWTTRGLRQQQREEE